MAEVIMYTTVFCPFCMRAKALLGDKGVHFQEIDVMFDPAKRAEMTNARAAAARCRRSSSTASRSADFDELYDLERQGRLNDLLGIAA